VPVPFSYQLVQSHLLVYFATNLFFLLSLSSVISVFVCSDFVLTNVLYSERCKSPRLTCFIIFKLCLIIRLVAHSTTLTLSASLYISKAMLTLVRVV
jgi:hypothetical protein